LSGAEAAAAVDHDALAGDEGGSRRRADRLALRQARVVRHASLNMQNEYSLRMIYREW
jgi:hypothetical protein